jgi:tRNA (adenine22-N1)-methyltransferase
VSRALPDRLRSVDSLVPHSATGVADVGAGHGALCAALSLRGCAPVIATEFAPGPLAELRSNLVAWGLTSRVEVRCGPGLAPLRFREVDTVVVAGLGANTVLSIAADAPARGVRWLVLQCMQRDQLVVPWLGVRGWPVLASDVCVQRRRTYPARLVEVGA